jgi:hypothetical protein
VIGAERHLHFALAVEQPAQLQYAFTRHDQLLVARRSTEQIDLR